MLPRRRMSLITTTSQVTNTMVSIDLAGFVDSGGGSAEEWY